MPLLGGKRKNILFISLIGFLLFTLYIPLKYIGDYGVVGAFRPTVRIIESGIVSYKTLNYSVVESENFVVRYDNVSDEVKNLVLETAEDKYEILAETFNYKFDEKVEIIVYNDVNTMMEATMLRGERAPMGVYFGNSIHIYNPIYWIADNENLEKIFYTEGPILHELAHKFTDHIARGNYPTWFTEGVSLYFEYIVDDYEWGKNLELDDEIYSIENLTNSFDELNVYYAYTQSFRLVREYVEKNGQDSLIQLIEELGRGKKLDAREFQL